MKKSIFKIIGPLFILFSLSGCADLEEHPVGILSPANYFQSEADLKAAILGIYNSSTANSVLGDNLYLDIVSDEFDVDPATVRPYRFAFNEYVFGSTDYREITEYLVGFSQIAHANMILAKVDGMDLDENIRNSYKAEALFMRALVYYQFIRIYGDVQYLTETMADPSDGSTLVRTPAEEIYQNIIEDLKWCVEHLPDQYPNGLRSRATRGTALTTLASIHLTLATYNDVYDGAYEYRSIDKALIDNLKGTYSSHWEAAAGYALRVINEKGAFGYELVNNFQDLFNGEIGDVNEFILSVDFYSESTGGGVTGGLEGYRNQATDLTPIRKPLDVGGWSAIVPPLTFYNSFIPGDYRREVSFEVNFANTTAPVGGDTIGSLVNYNALTKAKIKAPNCAKWTRYPGPCASWPNGNKNSMNIPIFRYAEVLLIAAEALNEIGRTGEAISLLNQLRERARIAGGENRLIPLDIPSGLSKEQCWETIWQEQSYELAFEWKRWFNLVRRDSLESVMSRFVPFLSSTALGGNVKHHHILLPIPQSEIDKAPNMKQNKGY